MKKLIDKDVHLLWHIYPTKEVFKKYRKDAKFKDITTELNSWISPNIDYFITSVHQIGLGNYLCENLITHYHIKDLYMHYLNYIIIIINMHHVQVMVQLKYGTLNQMKTFVQLKQKVNGFILYVQ
jgi:hypothetical protein